MTRTMVRQTKVYCLCHSSGTWVSDILLGIYTGSRVPINIINSVHILSSSCNSKACGNVIGLLNLSYRHKSKYIQIILAAVRVA